MDSFFNLVQTEQWRRIIKCERYTKGLIKYSTYVYIAEYSGVDVRKDETLSQRYDQTFFIPLLIIEKLPDKFHNLVEDCKITNVAKFLSLYIARRKQHFGFERTK